MNENEKEPEKKKPFQLGE